MLWIALHFPDLPLAIFARGAVRELPAVVSSASHRPDVVVASDAAKRRGIVRGLSIAAALALDPELVIHLRDERTEAAALKSIALWAGQWTSTVSIEPPASVLLEASACLNYFGGLDRLLGMIETGLRELGFNAVIAVAPTAGGASLFARALRRERVEPSDDLTQRIAALSIELLAAAQAELATLAGLGVQTIGDLIALPRDGIARRFGQELLDEIDRACGNLPDARALFVAPERYHGQIELPSPVDETEALLFAIKRLVVELAGFLQGRGAGVTRLRCDLIHDDAPPTSIVLGLSCTRQSEHMLTVLRERLARESLPDRVEAIRLVSEEIAPLAAKEGDFFPISARDSEAAPKLIERLRARLGEEAVRQLMIVADHRPELAWRYRIDEMETPARSAVGIPKGALRPLWLFSQPRSLDADAIGSTLILVSGPERIESGWWDGNEIRRDYFVGRNAQGEELWLYRDRGGEWFVHGVFA